MEMARLKSVAAANGPRSEHRSVRQILKKGTKRLHRQAEYALESKASMQTTEGLSHFLYCMLAAQRRFCVDHDYSSELAAIEPMSGELILALEGDPLLSEQRRFMGQSSVKSNTAFSLGVGYVFEGSAIGAAVLKKRLQKTSISTPQYLTLLSMHSCNRWPRYLETLDSCSDEMTALAGAVTVFEFIINQAESENGYRR